MLHTQNKVLSLHHRNKQIGIMETEIQTLIKRSNKTTIQTLVRNFDIERLGYMYADVIEDAFNVKKGTASFGIAVSELFSAYKVNKIRLVELDLIMKNSMSKYKLHYSIEVKRENMKIYNDAADEFKMLNNPLSVFVKECNKVLKSK